jgi:hypothetical protein
MTPADQVRNSYALLSNIYGHEIENGRDDEENQEIDCLREMYDDGILHGNGFAVRSNLTDGIGFLVIDELPEGGLSEEAVSGFGRTHGLALQTALAWDGEGRDVAACFVPIAFMDRVTEIIAAVADVARPEVRASEVKLIRAMQSGRGTLNPSLTSASPPAYLKEWAVLPMGE